MSHAILRACCRVILYLDDCCDHYRAILMHAAKCSPTYHVSSCSISGSQHCSYLCRDGYVGGYCMMIALLIVYFVYHCHPYTYSLKWSLCTFLNEFL